MGKHVHEVMMARPQAVTRDTTLSQAAQLMETEDVGALPVVEDSFLVGMVTDRDIVVRAVAHDLDPRFRRSPPRKWSSSIRGTTSMTHSN